MPELTVTRALPNPPGKDHAAGRMPTNDKLNEEWVEFRNGTDRRLLLDGCSILHYTFNASCVKQDEDRLMTLGGTLGPGAVARVHSGTGTDYVEGGNVLHLYAGRTNYVWNNHCGDTIVLRAKDGNLIDWASYKGGVGNGVILKRVPGTNTLTVTGAIAA
jgi:Lamin Tail Domain